jgi:hypothetical protein
MSDKPEKTAMDKTLPCFVRLSGKNIFQLAKVIKASHRTQPQYPIKT